MRLATTLLNSVATQGSVFRSLRFRGSAAAYLSRTPASAGNRNTWTYSLWVKRGSLSNNYPYLLGAPSDGANSIRFGNAPVDNTLYVGNVGSFATTQVFRDPAAWYHIVVAVDTTQATDTNRVKIYVNGSQVTSFSTATYPTQNFNTSINNNVIHTIGQAANNDTLTQFDGQLAQINFVDGQQLTPSAFGQTNPQTGVWEPSYFRGTFGTNGFYLPFTDTTSTTTLGYDFSGNSNNWTTNNFSLTAGATYDSMPDVPTLSNNVSANYCTLNAVMTSTSDVVVSNGGSTLTSNYASGWQNGGSTFAVKTGKWYYEATATIVSASDKTSIGVLPETVAFIGNVNQDLSSYGISGHGAGTGGYSYVQGDTIMVAIDADNSKVYYGKNGTWFGTLDPSAGTGSTTQTMTAGLFYTPIFGGYGGSQWNVNFGQRPFAYTVPTGFKILNTYNLPDSAVVQGNRVMDATLWTGNNANPETITNAAGFKPDFVWVKARSSGQSHVLNDSVRGAGTAYGLASQVTDAEGNADIISYGATTAFNSNGFSVGAGTSNQAFVNLSGVTYVGWQWQAGQGTTSTNNNGSITSNVSVNTTAGFSVVGWTGTGSVGTLGHGLGVTPKMIFGKRRDGTSNWFVYHENLGNTKGMNINTTDPASTNSGWWNNTSPTSSVFTMGSYETNNGSPSIAYCWAEVDGFSKFGSYTGNGSQDGPFIYTGFRPKFFLIKRTDAARNWYIYDTSRDPYNSASSLELEPNLSSAEASSTSGGFDILSNGVKIRTNWSNYNESTATYIYVAFAENPFKNSLAR